MKGQLRTVPVSRMAPIDPARIPQHTKLQIGAIFLRAFKQDCETPEFQEYYQRWKQERAATAAKEKEITT